MRKNLFTFGEGDHKNFQHLSGTPAAHWESSPFSATVVGGFWFAGTHQPSVTDGKATGRSLSRNGEERHLLLYGWWAESCRYVRLQAAVDETSGTEDWRPPDIEAITVRSQSRLAGQPMGIQTVRRQRVMGQ